MIIFLKDTVSKNYEYNDIDKLIILKLFLFFAFRFFFLG